MRMKNNPTNITSSGASKKLVPELRFPEFVNDREWDEDVFGQLFTYLPNNTLSRAELTEKKGTIQNIHYGDILIKYSVVLDANEELIPSIIDTEKIKNVEDSCLRDGDIIIADTAEDETVGKCTEIVNVENSLIVSGLHTIPCRPNIFFEKGYLGHYMNSNAFHNRLRPLMQGAKVTSISKSGLKSILFTYPHSQEEQKKIALCLSFVDKLVVDTKSKVEQLKEHKKGLLQQLFPVKGKTHPMLRFPMLNNEEEWEEKELKDVCHMQAGKYISAAEISENGLYPCYGGNGMRGKTNEYNYSGTHPIIGRQGALCGNVNLIDGKFYATEHAVVVTPKKEYDSTFLYYILCYLNLNQYATGQAQPGLAVDSILRIKCSITHNLDEQKKIASVLLSLDEMLEQYSERVKALELQKKGLMQRLFPNINSRSI